MMYYHHQVTPFGNLRIKACLRLPEAYRSLSRPSSPVGTKASTVCPSKLDSLFKETASKESPCFHGLVSFFKAALFMKNMTRTAILP